MSANASGMGELMWILAPRLPEPEDGTPTDE
jgi:hypothetical protein